MKTPDSIHCRPGTTDAMQRLADENEALRKALSDDQIAKTMMTDLNLRDGGINMSIEGGISAVLVNCFADQFKQVGGKNYVEMNFRHPEVGSMTVTLQRKEGKTPGELRAEVLAKNEALRAERDEISRKLGTCMESLANTRKLKIGIEIQRDGLAARVQRLLYCAKESQTWNWISAQEAGFEQAMDRYDIDDMQELHEIAHDETPAQSLAHIRAAGAREALERAMQSPGFSDTVVRVDVMREIIEQMEGE